MCGIIGAFSVSARRGRKDCFKRAMSLLRHRGPDDSGFLELVNSAGTLMLGHQRLAIIDLSAAGRQPMQSADGRYVMVFNGEIYNYIELREELLRLRYRFTTKTDTEVLLVAWAHWGIDCLAKLDGMFAFAVYDRLANDITLVRDAFGIKPLYYELDTETLCFASELSSLGALRSRPSQINKQRAYDFLVWGNHDDDESTFFADFVQIKPGHFSKVKLSGDLVATQQRWWWPNIKERPGQNFHDAADELRALFLQSVRRQLRSDVAVGVTLSGGVDSSAIACAVRHLEPDLPIHTFSYAEPESEFTEDMWMGLVANRIGAVEHRTGYAANEMGEDFDDIVRAQGEPFGSTSIAAGYRVYQLARINGVTVTLDGQGADELLGGYDGYPDAVVRSHLDRFQYWEAFSFIRNWAQWPGRSARGAMISMGEAMVPSGLRSLALRAAGYQTVPPWLDGDVLRDAGVSLLPPLPRRSFEGHGRRLPERLCVALTSNRLPALLRYGDRNSMRWSVESRLPFLSTAMAEFVLALPECFLVSPKGQTKHIFREAMRGIVPDAILDRRDKIGLETPERAILNDQKDRITTWMDAAAEIDFLRIDPLRQAVKDILSGRRRFSYRAWRLVGFCRWASLQDSAVLGCA
jgi:asparagine synthase (glutamine-hydrolysing)